VSLPDFVSLFPLANRTGMGDVISQDGVIPVPGRIFKACDKSTDTIDGHGASMDPVGRIIKFSR
jgi:hypothetical protein